MGRYGIQNQQKWLYYSIEDDKSFMFSKKEEDFVSYYSDEDVKELDLYNILEVSPDSSYLEIKKKYHKLH